MKGSWEELDNEVDPGFKRAGSMVDLSAPSEKEMEVIRNAVIQHEGLLVSVFDVLRRVPRRVLMVLKLNDLTRYVNRVKQPALFLSWHVIFNRSLDYALATTHASVSRSYDVTMHP